MSPTLAELGLDVIERGGKEVLTGDKDGIVLTEEGAEWLNKAYISGVFSAGQRVRLSTLGYLTDALGKNKWAPVKVVISSGVGDDVVERIAVELEKDNLFKRSST